MSNLTTFEYDTKGRISKKYFNTNDYEQYEYDPNTGYLYKISFNGTIVWQLTNMDAYGRTTGATIGVTPSIWQYKNINSYLLIKAEGVQEYSYIFTGKTSNLAFRHNHMNNRMETFRYDSLNIDKLTKVTENFDGGIDIDRMHMAYSSNRNGNIAFKSGVGTYAYENASKPYAVTNITADSITALGNNIDTTKQIIGYYSFEKVKKISEGTKTAEFDYNSDHQRIRMVLKNNGQTTKTRYYFGGSCEREVINGVTTQYIWIGGDAYSAVAVAKKVGTGAWTVYNIFRDHLGSITHLKNGSNLADEYSFDAWGKRRNATTWSDTLDVDDKALFADRGFTGHEYLEDFKLYNMNGRLYDPVVGRFLSPDITVQDPSNTQSYNRYSYCLNNPLKFTDPSGNTWWSSIGNWIKGGFDNLGDWMDKHPTEVGYSSGPNPTFFFKTKVNGNTDVGVGVDTQTWQFGIGNNSSGSMQFFYPSKNYDIAAQNFVTKTLPNVRSQYGDEWQAANRRGLGTASMVFGASGVAGDFASMSNSTFRITNGVVNGSMLSPRIYGSGWNGGSAAGITTYSFSSLGGAVSFGAGVVTTAMAYNEIYNGSPQSITYIDAGVGTVGVMSSIASYYSGIQIPYIGEGVAVYGTLRLTWDGFFNLGANYGPIGAYYGINKWSGR